MAKLLVIYFMHFRNQFLLLQVYDGNSESSTLLETLCGSSLPASITSSGNTVYLVFTSDAMNEFAGFQLAWTGIEDCYCIISYYIYDVIDFGTLIYFFSYCILENVFFSEYAAGYCYISTTSISTYGTKFCGNLGIDSACWVSDMSLQCKYYNVYVTDRIANVGLSVSVLIKLLSKIMFL